VEEDRGKAKREGAVNYEIRKDSFEEIFIKTQNDTLKTRTRRLEKTSRREFHPEKEEKEAKIVRGGNGKQRKVGFVGMENEGK